MINVILIESLVVQAYNLSTWMAEAGVSQI